MHSIIQALRSLMRYRSSTFINVAGLALGLTCSLVIAQFIRHELSFDAYHRQAGNTYRVVEDFQAGNQTLHWNTTAYPLADALRADFADLAVVTQAAGPMQRLFKIENGAAQADRYEDNVLFVDQYYAKVFDFVWRAGNPATALLQPNSAVLTESVARKYFGSDTDAASILGKRIMLNNTDGLLVTGVVADLPSNTALRFGVLVPYEFYKINNPYYTGNWSGNYQGSTFVVLHDTEARASVEQRIATWKKKYLKPEDDRRIDYHLQPLQDAHTDTVYGASPGSYTIGRKILYAAAGIALFILVVACVNFINLATAQAANRAREVGIRKVLGSSRAGLAWHFLKEHTLVVAMAVLVSLALAQFSIAALNSALAVLDLNLHLDAMGVVLAVVIGVAVVVLACIFPAFVLASYKPVYALKAKITTATTGGMSLRRLLIVTQFSIVQLFVIGTIVVATQMRYFKNKDLGFVSDAVAYAPIDDTNKAEPLAAQLNAHATIAGTTMASSAPLSTTHHYGTAFRLPSEPEEAGREAEMKGADLRYLDFFKLELVAGRNFSRIDDNFSEFIVNESVVQAMGWTPGEAIGRTLHINEGDATIVGVVKDFHNNPLQEAITPCVLINWRAFLSQAFIRVAPGTAANESLHTLESTWKAAFPERVYAYNFLDDAVAKQYALQDMVFDGFKVASGVAIAIGCLGLYGLLSFMAARKTKEVGIRKVLGASVSQLVGLFSREFLMLVAVSFVVAAPLAYFAMEQWLADFVYRIDMAWWMFAAGVIITVAITVATTSYQSVKAALANPVDALRNE